MLLSGVTSSGKSTSLKSFIETLPGLDQKAIYTVEDPIEHEIAGAHQIEVLRDIANDDETRRCYAEAMRALMRSDPDGVMLGEIRDKLTALFALQIAEAGHLAMGTEHAHLISNISAPDQRPDRGQSPGSDRAEHLENSAPRISRDSCQT